MATFLGAQPDSIGYGHEGRHSAGRSIEWQALETGRNLFEYLGEEIMQQALIDEVQGPVRALPPWMSVLTYFTQAMAPPWRAPVESA